MRIGISLTSSYPGATGRDGARFMIERARAAYQAGLDSLSLGDHHIGSEPYYQGVPMLGRLLAEWPDRVAGALFLLPLWNPVLVAEQVGTLACLHSGPFVLQVGVGAGRGQFAGMGVDIRVRGRLMEEALVSVRRLLAGEEVGPARISPLPPDPVMLWVGADAPPAIDRAARLGDAWYASPHYDESEAARRLDHYRSRCAEHGRPAAAAIRRDVHVGDPAAVPEGYRGFPPGAVVAGPPDEVAARLARFGEIGFDEVVVRMAAARQDDAVASIAALAAVRALLPS